MAAFRSMLTGWDLAEEDDGALNNLGPIAGQYYPGKIIT
jgi:hypothetical protein